MAKAATPVGGALIELPEMSADVAAYFEQEANVKPKVTVPSISPGGKKWTLSLDGQDTVLSRTNAENDIEPIQIFKAFVLAHAERRGRAYYVGGFDPAKPGVPVCWSDDGVRPNDKVEVKQNPTCEGCPMAAKGSKITDNNKSVRACGEHRMLALIPAGKLDFPFLRMKIAMTSDWDGQSPDHDATGWYAWSNYLDVLRARMPNACHTGRVVTKMKFDPNVDYPKILFSLDRGTKPEEAAILVPRMRAERATLDALISGTFTPNGRDGTRTDTGEDDVNRKEGEQNAGLPAQPKPQGGAPAAAAKEAEAPKAPVGPTPAQLALAAAKKALADAEAAANAPPAETPKQKALREAKEALAAAEAEAGKEGDETADAKAATSFAENVGGDDDDGEINLPDGNAGTTAPAATGKAATGAAAGGAKATGAKAGTGKAAGAGKATATAASTPPAAGTEALKGLLTDWE